MIPYEKVMPILVKMPKTFSSTKFRTFSPRVAKYQRETWLMNKWNVLYFIYTGHGGKLVPPIGKTCNSKLQIIKISFDWSVDPKRCGTLTSKIHISSTVRNEKMIQISTKMYWRWLSPYDGFIFKFLVWYP